MATDKYGNELDLEYVYPPKSERVICAGDERHADHERRLQRLEENDADTMRQVHYLNERTDLFEKRIAALEVAAIANKPHWLTPPNVNEWIAQNPPFAAAHPPEADYAHIPAAEWEDICAELEGLRTQWAEVPWAALRDPELFDNSATIGAWIRAEAPKEATE